MNHSPSVFFRTFSFSLRIVRNGKPVYGLPSCDMSYKFLLFFFVLELYHVLFAKKGEWHKSNVFWQERHGE